MELEQFNHEVEKCLDRIRGLLVSKGKEYSNDSDKFHNFKLGGKLSNQHPSIVLQGFLLKHYISYIDILNNINKSIPVYPEDSLLEEKLTDILCYFLLQLILIKEQKQIYETNN